MESPSPHAPAVKATAVWLPLRYWGKADPRYPQEPKWHPLPYHALDVAAVGHAYLTHHPRLLAHFATVLGLSGAQTLAWLTFWIALHDLGKFASAFQGQREDLAWQLQNRKIAISYTLRHDSLGALVWKNRLLAQCDVLGPGAGAGKRLMPLAPWVLAVTGHHGEPPHQDRDEISLHFAATDVEAAAQFVAAARALLLPQDVLDAALALGKRLERAGKRLSWWLAGLTVLADWIGSNTAFFRYRNEEIPLRCYWDEALAAAELALRASGVVPQARGASHTLPQLFGWADPAKPRSATPLQAWASEVVLPDAPQLYLLEDVTGAGKTEAALMLAHRLMQGGHADGIYFGLPTMATANAMLPRVQAIAGKLFAADAQPSVVLAHGQRKLVASFRDSVMRANIPEIDPAQRDDQTASARCAAWLADSTKKALLAHVGVGTIDQAHLAVLRAKHQSLRLLGLFRKVLIVDEVHACDPYMQRLLERLLQFHAAAGGSAILLSATLPQHMKQALADAFASGCDSAWTPTLTKSDYPLAIQMAANRIPLEQPLETRPEVRRQVAVDYLSDLAQVHARIDSELASGRCVCWVRNTVADAIAAWQHFADVLGHERVELFHARFAMGDRLAIEQRVIAQFGEHSDAAQRAGRLVIATQVVEQSLDVDFDLLVSDLAPIDRLIQRAGRLQRHVRDAAGNRIEGADLRGGARMVVFGPAFSENPAADWYRAVFPGAVYVYPHVGQLWLSARNLQRGGFAMPGDGRAMIEGVFGEAAQAEIPEALHKATLAVEGKDWAAVNIAVSNALGLDSGYARGGGDWLDDTDQSGPVGFDDWAGDSAATRLGDATAWVRLACWQDGELRPWHTDGWEASGLRLPSRLIAEPILTAEQQAAKERIEPDLPNQGRWSVLLPLAAHDGQWRAQAKDAQGKARRWHYDEKMGLSECA